MGTHIVSLFFVFVCLACRGWSGGAMVLGKLPVLGRPTIWITVGQGPTALAVGAGGFFFFFFDIFTLIYPFSLLSPSLWEMARYRLKYCLKGPLNPKQPTNHLACNYRIYLAIRRGFCPSRMTSNNLISPMKFCSITNFILPKQSQRSRSVLQDRSGSLGLFWKEKTLSFN